MSLSQNSKFAQLCPSHDLKVDCAYFTDDEIEVEEDPTASVKFAMNAMGELLQLGGMSSSRCLCDCSSRHFLFAGLQKHGDNAGRSWGCPVGLGQ